MIRPDRSSWVSRLPSGPPRVGRRLEVGQDVVVEEVGERPVPDVMEEPGHPQGLDHQPFGRDRLARVGERRPQARVERPRPESRLVHDPEAVGEPRVLGGREDPARALQLADPAQPLEPRRVEQVLLGGVLGREPGRRRLVRRQSLGQLHVPVDRVADEVDRGERLAAHVGQGTQITHLAGPRPDVAGPVGRPDPDAVASARGGPVDRPATSSSLGWRPCAHAPAVDRAWTW